MFAEALAQAPSVLGVVLSHDQRGEASETLMVQDKVGFAFGGDAPDRFVPRFGAAVEPLAALGQAAVGLGALNWIPGSDLVVRQVPLVFQVGEIGLVPTAGAVANALYQYDGVRRTKLPMKLKKKRRR